jgi:hypothetical protein
LAYFETTGPRLDVESRVKEMALLSEELLFEPGVLDVSVADTGLMSFWHPPGTWDEVHLRQRREGAQKGQPFYLGMARQAGPGQPAEAPTHAVISGPLEHGFLAEFEFSLSEWGLEGLPWARTVWPLEHAQQVANEIVSAERLKPWANRGSPDLSDNSFLDDRLKEDLTRDLAWGSAMGLPVAVDELHGPMLEFKASQEESHVESRDAPGSAALRVWVPDFSQLPWPDVIALHDHDAIGAFREKMLEAERGLVGVPEEARETVLRDFFLTELADKLSDLMPSPSKVGLEIGGGLLFDAVSSVIPLVGTLASATRAVAEYQREQARWTAVLVALVRQKNRANAGVGDKE